ncbi:unnamed protein product [Alopecurus aequalis]
MSSPNFPGRFSWVVLRKDITILDADEKRQESLFMGEASKDWADIKDGSSILQQFSLDAHLVEPPELSTLYVRAKLEVQQRGIACILDSVAENFVYMTLVLDNSVYGLVYDAAKNSLSLLPTAMEAFAGHDFARSDISVPFEFLRQPAVLQRDDGSYYLLNLGFMFDGFFRRGQVLQPSGILFQWSSAVKRWTKQDVRFNPQTLLPSRHRKRLTYEVDVSFTFKGRVFWADLLLGAIVCDTGACAGDEDRVELGFVHLPEECRGQALEEEGYYRHAFEDAYPRDRRTMGPVGDSIKLISIVTTDGDTPDDHTHARDVVLRSWTLAPDLCSWTRDHDMELPLPLLWESDTYKREMLPEAIPMNPVLKDDEDGVLYLLLGDYYVDWHRHARLCRTMECVISVDMRRKCLLSRSRRPITDGLPPPPEVQPSKRFHPDMPTLFGVKSCAQHTE